MDAATIQTRVHGVLSKFCFLESDSDEFGLLRDADSCSISSDRVNPGADSPGSLEEVLLPLPLLWNDGKPVPHDVRWNTTIEFSLRLNRIIEWL